MITFHELLYNFKYCMTLAQLKLFEKGSKYFLFLLKYLIFFFKCIHRFLYKVEGEVLSPTERENTCIFRNPEQQRQ